MLLKWDEVRFTTGISEVDNQHKKLFRGINDLIEAIAKGGGSGSSMAQQSAIKTLDFLGKYAIDHFKCEEGYMDRYASPLREKNKTEHEKFVQQFIAMKAKIEENGLTRELVLKLQGFLCGWLTHHIEKVDKSLYDVRPREENIISPELTEKKPESFFSVLWRRIIGK